MAARITFDELDRQFTRFIRDEDQTLWEQGDALAAYNPADAELAKLAEHHGRTVATLRTRMKVATEFPPGSRDAGAFSVYAQLLKVHDPARRAGILAERQPGEWTIDAMTTRVAQYLRDTGATRRAADMRKAGMRLGDYRITGELSDDGLILTIDGPGLASAGATTHKVGGKILARIA